VCQRPLRKRIPSRPSCPTADNTLWGIHGGKTGDADGLFLRGNVIAVGWDKVKASVKRIIRHMNNQEP
jgi:hypothetical protein